MYSVSPKEGRRGAAPLGLSFVEINVGHGLVHG